MSPEKTIDFLKGRLEGIWTFTIYSNSKTTCYFGTSVKGSHTYLLREKVNGCDLSVTNSCMCHEGFRFSKGDLSSIEECVTEIEKFLSTLSPEELKGAHG